MRAYSVYAALLCSFATLFTACAREFPSSILTAQTDVFINQVLADWNVSGGAAVAVVRKSPQGHWNIETKGYGVATLNGSKVTENTRFGIGSNSKVRILVQVITAWLTSRLNIALHNTLSWASY